MTQKLPSIATLAVLAFAVWLGVATLARTPAFNPSHRGQTAQGGGILGFSEAMYDRAAYNLWIAMGWYGRSVVEALPGTEGADPDRAETAETADTFERIAAAATRSLRHSPGQPAAWMLLARAHAGRGEGEAALAVYRTMQALTPDNANEATRRLRFLSALMSDTEIRDLALETLDADIVRADMKTMRDFGISQRTAERIAQSPAISEFLRRTEQYR